ncbi:MAG: protein kinase [Kofleriaceae bacterium]
MQHLDDLLVIEYLARRLPAARVAEIQEHIDACPDCLNLVAAMIEAAPPATMPAGAATTTTISWPRVDPNHYAIGETIASGGMGRILAATDLRLDRPIAIKELLVDNEQLRARFEREVRITAKLQHPSIVNIIEAGVWPGGEPFFAMKRVVGESLAKRLRKTTTLDERLGLLANMIALADAIAYAHDRRIIHRDLKPDNVLLGDYGESVVIDWGLAKHLDSDDAGDLADLAKGTPASDGATVAGAVLGTPSYMPPEQALGDPVDERADVYALGAMLYELLSGHPPYRGPSVQAVLAAVVDGPPPPLRSIVPGVPRDLATIAEKAMAREPEQRYRTAKPLAEDLRRFQTGQLVASHHYSFGQRLARWVRRHRTAVAVGAAAICVLAVVLVISVRGIIEARERADAQRLVAETSRREAEAAHAMAETRRGDAEELMDFMLGDLRRKLERIGKIDLLAVVAKKAADYYSTRPPPDSPEDMRRQIQTGLNLGSVLSMQGDSKGALAVFTAAVGMSERLVTVDPHQIANQADLVRTRSKLSQVQAMQGDIAKARVGFETVIRDAEAILASNPEHAHGIAAAQDGHLRLGDILRAQGDLTGAIDHGMQAIAMARKLVELDPANVKYQRGLSLCLRVLAEVYKQQQSYQHATPLVLESVKISEALLAKDPEDPALGMDVVRTREDLAEVYEQQGDLDKALEAVLSLRTLAMTRFAQDPDDATRRYDAGMALRRVGKIRQTRKEYAIALTELREAAKLIAPLIQKDPATKMWQQGMSYVQSDLGRVLDDDKQLARALPHYIAARDLRKELLKRDPTNSNVRNDLALSHELVANTLRDLGKRAEAVAELKASVALTRELVAAQPDDESRTVMLFALLAHLGEAQALAKHKADAIKTYEESLSIVTALSAKDPGTYVEELDTIRKALARLKP